MGYLENSKLYLSGAIENDSNSQNNWRDIPKKVLRERFKINVFDPFEDPKQQWTKTLIKAREEENYEEIISIAKNFVQKDLCEVDISDFLIAYLPYKVATVGTHHEIIHKYNLKKPVLLVCPQGKQYLPFWYWGFINKDFMFSSFEDLYNYLDEVDKGLHKNNRRWNYLYKLI
jgi:nucleoside 2-deoxyribosyltransferase